MSAKLSSLPAIQRHMQFRVYICLLVCGFCSCGPRSNKALEQCERQLDSLELLLQKNPGFAAGQTTRFMAMRKEITEKIDALNNNPSLSESEIQERDMLALRRSVLFTAAMEQALDLTRKQSDSLNKLKDSVESGF
jgi:hypothetical protein